MFRRLPGSLPKDPKFPANMKELGFFINGTAHIRSIEDPERNFIFFITNNDRYNGVHREAMAECVRSEITARMNSLKCPPLYLPHLTTSKPPSNEPHTSIYCTSQAELKTKKSIVIAINNGGTDLGVWSYRSLYREGGLEGGSCISLLKACQSGAEFHLEGDEEEPGLIILNPGQLIYSHRKSTALTHTSWLDQPRASAVHPPNRIHPVHNLIPGNTSAYAHVAFVFDNIICNPSYVSPDARIFIIALVDGGRWLLEYLDTKLNRAFATCSSFPLLSQIASLALIQPTHSPSELTSPALKTLLADRSRSYIVSPYDRGTLLAAPWADQKPNEWDYVPEIDSPVYASGEHEVAELIFTGGDGASGNAEGREVGRMRRDVLGWFGIVAKADREGSGGGKKGKYVNPRKEVAELLEQDGMVDGEGEGALEAIDEGVEKMAIGDDEAPFDNKVGPGDASCDGRRMEGIAGPRAQMRDEITDEFANVKPENEREKVEVAGWDIDKDLLEKAGLL